jgi:5,10-methylenetetrahydromethanopterin reductase
MELGAILLWGEDIDSYRRQLRLCAELGYDHIGLGDTPAGWRDLGASLTIAAEEAPGTTISTMVTAPFMRHPLNTANLMSTLDGLNGCKSVLGFATGGSNVMAIGHKPATIAQTRQHILTLRKLFAGEGAEFEGAPVKPLRFASNVPILLSAMGPKALALAGEVADGAILFTGDRDEELDELEQRMEAVRASARGQGRDPDALIFWVCGYSSIRDTRQQALDDLLAFIAVTGVAMMMKPEMMALIPDQFRDRVQRLQREYDPTEHIVPGGKNVALMRELGLAEYLGNYDVVAGTPDEVGKVMDRLETIGVDAFFITVPGHEDPESTIRAMAEILGKTTKTS